MSDVRQEAAPTPVEDTNKGESLVNRVLEISTLGLSKLISPDNIEAAAKFIKQVGFPDVEIEMEPTFAGPSLEHPGTIKERIEPSDASAIEYITYEDGTQRQIMPSGDIIENRADGTYVHMKPDHSVTTITKDGTVTKAEPKHSDAKEVTQATVNNDGSVSYKYADGTNEQVWFDEQRSVKFPDGSGYFKYSKEMGGGLDAFHANGDSESYDADAQLVGTWRTNDKGVKIQRGKSDQVNSVVAQDQSRRDFIRSLQTGELEEIHGHLGVWKPTQLPDGETGWKNETTGAVWAGKMEVDKDGNLRYTPHDGGQAYTFTPDGRDIKVKR